ncbi:MAG: dUTP diphosphatase [Luteolibacter sp.]
MKPFQSAFVFEASHPELMPSYETEDSTGADLRISDDLSIPSGRTGVMATGVRIVSSVPVVESDRGLGDLFFDLQIRPKSGRSAKGLQVILGTIDHGYRGEIMVVAHNVTDQEIVLKRGEKIAQLVAGVVARLGFPVKDVVRGEGGFGSTGAT